jgi:hypothetical protein
MWTDPWIPREGARTPVTPRRQNVLTHVHDLLDPNTGTWDEQLLQDIFWPTDANAILKIPNSRTSKIFRHGIMMIKLYLW